MAEYTIDDMIASAIEKKPDTFNDAFKDIMAQKVAAAVELKKQELSQTLFSDEAEEEDQDSQETDLDQSDTDSQNTEAEDQDG